MASSQAHFPTMTTSRDAPNPLRPYYVPPSVGIHSEQPINASASAAATASRASVGRTARDLLADLDYGGPLLESGGPTLAELAKKLVDQAIWKYTSVLLAQPFDVAKTILQVRLAAEIEDDETKTVSRRQSRDSSRKVYSDYKASETESSEDEPSYFTPTKPPKTHDSSPSRRHHRRRRTPSRSGSSTPMPSSANFPHKLNLRRPDSIVETLAQLWQRSGATGLWKATNATFIYNVLVKAVESWTRNLLCALINLPDPGALIGGPSDIPASAMGGLDITDSPSPLVSLGVAVAAAGIAGVLLAPLDLVRTKLILTPTTTGPRAILPSLRLLPSLTPPSGLLPITILHSSLPSLLNTSVPLLLRTYLHIDPLTTPTLYSISTFMASTTELFLKLPLETVLRRGQIHVLKTQHARAYNAAAHNSFRGDAGKIAESRELATVVDPGAYQGVFGTMWAIATEEGVREPKTVGGVAIRKVGKKGQGVQGLWRGWRVGMWGLVGVWGASAMGSGGGVGGEF